MINLNNYELTERSKWSYKMLWEIIGYLRINLVTERHISVAILFVTHRLFFTFQNSIINLFCSELQIVCKDFLTKFNNMLQLDKIIILIKMIISNK